MLRDTGYAEELARAIIDFGNGHEGRIERLFVKDQNQEEIRFSWWKEGKLIPRPLDLSEKQLLTLLRTALTERVFSDQFLAELRVLLSP